MSEKRRMTSKEWIRAEAMFESGDYTLQDIADEFDIHKITVQRHMKKRGIEKGAAAKKIRKAVEKRMEAAVEEEVDVTTQRIRETKERHFMLNATIDKRITRELVEAEREGRSIATAGNAFKALKMAAETLRVTRANAYEILGVSNEDVDEIPSLEIREMLDDEVAEIRDGQREQADEMGLNFGKED